MCSMTEAIPFKLPMYCEVDIDICIYTLYGGKFIDNWIYGFKVYHLIVIW